MFLGCDACYQAEKDPRRTRSEAQGRASSHSSNVTQFWSGIASQRRATHFVAFHMPVDCTRRFNLESNIHWLSVLITLGALPFVIVSIHISNENLAVLPSEMLDIIRLVFRSRSWGLSTCWLIFKYGCNKMTKVMHTYSLTYTLPYYRHPLFFCTILMKVRHLEYLVSSSPL